MCLLLHKYILDPFQQGFILLVIHNQISNSRLSSTIAEKERKKKMRVGRELGDGNGGGGGLEV